MVITMQSQNVKDARVLEQYKLVITFENNEVRIFDMSPYLEYPVFRPLQNIEEFRLFSIEDGTIEWACGADLSPDTFYIDGKLQNSSAVM